MNDYMMSARDCDEEMADLERRLAESERVRRQLAEALRYFDSEEAWARIRWTGMEHHAHRMRAALAASDALEEKT